MDKHKTIYPVGKMCKHLKVSRNAYYHWRSKRPGNKKDSRKTVLINEIKRIFKESRQTYGSPRIQVQLEKIGYKISRAYVAKLMKEENIRFKPKKRFINTTYSKHEYKIEKNTLDRQFKVEQLGKVWVSDITYIRVNDKWVYLTTMIDLADRQVVGWSLSKDMTYENTVLKAWNIGRKRRQIIDGFILHSDRGVQYACNKIRDIFMANDKINRSMSRKGNCWDNAVAESFFKTIKSEMIYRNEFKSFTHAYNQVYDYIENWYNIKRIHSSLGYKTPLEKEIELRAYYKLAA